MSEQTPDDPVAVLRRWEGQGAVWRVVGRRAGAVTLGLFTCDGGEEVSRFTARDGGELAAFLAEREG